MTALHNIRTSRPAKGPVAFLCGLTIESQAARDAALFDGYPISLGLLADLWLDRIEDPSLPGEAGA